MSPEIGPGEPAPTSNAVAPPYACVMAPTKFIGSPVGTDTETWSPSPFKKELVAFAPDAPKIQPKVPAKLGAHDGAGSIWATPAEA